MQEQESQAMVMLIDNESRRVFSQALAAWMAHAAESRAMPQAMTLLIGTESRQMLS